jgi:glycosyltransferase involved in cell wall biosynthesis
MPKPSGLLHCIPDMLNGGSQRQLAYLAREQVRRGWEVHVAFGRPGPTAALLENTGVDVCLMEHRRSEDPRLLLDLCRLIRRIRPRVVQTWLLQMDVAGGLAATLMGIPWVLSERSSAGFYGGGLKERARALVARAAGAIVANSEGGIAYWRGRVPGAMRFQLIANIVPVDEIERSEPADDATLGLPAGRSMVLSVNRFSPIKNLPRLIASLSRVAKRLPMTAFLVGDGTHGELVRDAVRSGESADLVRVSGYRADVWRWMKRADALVSVSLAEGQPNAVLEAMAAGCPLVLSEIPAHREIADDSCAVFVDPSSVEAIADGLERCLSDPAAARRRASLARERVRALSADEAARRFEVLYREVVERRSGAAPSDGGPGCAE